MRAEPGFRYDLEDEVVSLRGNAIKRGDYAWIVPTEDLQDASAGSLRTALARYDGDYGVIGAAELSFTEQNQLQVDPDYPLTDGIGMRCSETPGALEVTIDFQNEEYLEDDDISPIVDQVARSMVTPVRIHTVHAEIDGGYLGPPWHFRAVVSVGTRSRSVADLHSWAQDVQALLDAAGGGQPLTPSTALGLLRARRPGALLGLDEGPWLDVKTQLYDVSHPIGKIKLARAVGRFANGEHGGLLVFGFGTTRNGPGERISKITPVTADRRLLRRHAQALEVHLYPPPDYLTAEIINVSGGQLLVIYVPPQPEELKPFLVHGAVVEGNVEGAFISIDRRRGEDSIPVTATMIHTWLSAGRALMRSGRVPGPPDEGESAQ
ncbi:MAG: sle [Acidimicrobiales bacterium]|nr:sle [Acidimicrobiales bacterium]